MAVVLGDNEGIQNPIEYCIEVILKEAKEEERLVKQLLYVMLSAYTNNPLNLGINSPSGEGKNWALEKVAEKFPVEDVESLSGMTDKALFHKKGILVVNRNDLDESFPKEYVNVDTLIEDIDSQIEEKEYEIEKSKERIIIKACKEAIREFENQKKDIYKNAKKLIDLSHKILVFLDTPRMGLLEAIMTLLSHDKYEVEYEYVDTHNGITTRNNILRGWPAVIYAQAIDYSKYERWPEIQRRFIVTNPEMDSKKKYSEAIDLMLDKFGLPDHVYQKVVTSDTEKDEVRNIIKYIRSEILLVSDRIQPGKNSTFIPFVPALKTAIAKERASDMNGGKRFSVFLSLLPQINIGRRPTIKIQTFDDKGPITQTVSFALFEDLAESIYLMEYSNGVRPYVLEWYYDVFLPTYNDKKEPASKLKTVGKTQEYVCEKRIAVTSTELIEATARIKGKYHTSHNVLQTLIYPLMNQGYIDCIESELDRRTKILFPVITTDNDVSRRQGKNILFSIGDKKTHFLEPSKINLTDPTTFPDKTYLISRIRWLQKYYSNDSILAVFCDHEGKEISIEDLVERYYKNPEKYFEKYFESEPPKDDSKKNTFQEVKTGSSYNNTTENMQDLEGSEAEDSKKFIYEEKKTQRILLSENGDKPIPDPDPTLAKTSRLLKNLQEAEQARKSKLAEAAEANQSGNGVLGSSKDKEGSFNG